MSDQQILDDLATVRCHETSPRNVAEDLAMLQAEKYQLVRTFFPAVAYCCAIYWAHPCRWVRQMKRLGMTAQPGASFSREVIFQGVKGHFGGFFYERAGRSKRGQAGQKTGPQTVRQARQQTRQQTGQQAGQ